MVSDLSLQEAVNAMGTGGKTTPKQIRAVFRRLCIPHSDKMIRGVPSESSALLSWQCDENRRIKHWVLWHNNKYYDPAAGVFRKVPKWLTDWHVTSHMKVVLCEDV